MRFGTNVYAFDLLWIQASLDSPPADRVLNAIGKGIRVIGESPLPVNEDDETGYYQALIEEGSDLCEALVGTSFVVCQTYVASVVAAVKDVHKSYCLTHHDTSLCATGEDKYSIIGFGSRRLPGSTYSLVQVIDAAANYFKHKDEWTQPWSAMDGHRGRTAEIVMAGGAKEGSTGNLRCLANSIGNVTFDDMEVLVDILRDWANELHDAYEAELSRLNLI
ncbi:hypothetical protein MJD09_00795 [bacterium]|nr:hypothetical protein [bacterium]